MYNSELRDRIKSAHLSQRQVANEMGFTENTLRNKLKGKFEFSPGEQMLLEKILSEKEDELESCSKELQDYNDGGDVSCDV